MNPNIDPDEVATPRCPKCETHLHFWQAEQVFTCFNCLTFWRLQRWPQAASPELLWPVVIRDFDGR